MKKNNILHIIIGLGKGGAEKTLYQSIIKTKNCFNHKVISLTDSGYYRNLLIDNSVEVYCCNFKKKSLNVLPFIRILYLLLLNRKYTFQTWMHHSNFLGGIIGKLFFVKKIYWNIRGEGISDKHSKILTKFIFKMNAKLSYFIPNKIITCSKSAINNYVNNGYKNNFLLIHNGCDTNIYKSNINIRKIYRKKLNLDDNIFVIGMAARFSRQKNHLLLLETLKSLNDKNIPFVCLLAGSQMNKMNKKLKNYIDELNLKNQVILLDQIDNINDFMNAIDIHVLTSSYGEGFPNVIIESMACETISISSDVGDSSIILNNNKFVFEKDNKQDFLKKLLYLYNIYVNDINTWKNISFKNHKIVKDFYSIEKMINDYKMIWTK